MSIETPFTKENLETYLKEVAKEYRKRSGAQKAEMILVGGASVLINYDFRESTYEIDADYYPASAMKEAVNIVGDRFDLPVGWLNTDFKQTAYKVLSVLKELTEKDGKTVVLSTHNPNHALYLDAEVFLLQKGTILDHGSAEEIVVPEKLKSIYGERICFSKELPYREISFS